MVFYTGITQDISNGRTQIPHRHTFGDPLVEGMKDTGERTPLRNPFRDPFGRGGGSILGRRDWKKMYNRTKQ